MSPVEYLTRLLQETSQTVSSSMAINMQSQTNNTENTNGTGQDIDNQFYGKGELE